MILYPAGPLLVVPSSVYVTLQGTYASTTAIAIKVLTLIFVSLSLPYYSLFLWKHFTSNLCVHKHVCCCKLLHTAQALHSLASIPLSSFQTSTPSGPSSYHLTYALRAYHIYASHVYPSEYHPNYSPLRTVSLIYTHLPMGTLEYRQSVPTAQFVLSKAPSRSAALSPYFPRRRVVVYLRNYLQSFHVYVRFRRTYY